MNVDKIIYGNFCVDRHPDGSLWEVGRGTMGVTYRAHDINLYCPVALKVVSCAGDAMVHERFIQQARAAARLRHRNVASVFFLGTDGGQVFCAMELIDGESLEAVVRRSGPLRLSVAVRVARQVAGALAAAARQGIVHGDLKPANIMLLGTEDEDGPLVKVVDFALPRLEGWTSGREYSATPLFASPEQLDGRAPDFRSDLYSLGCTLWFLLDGFPPFMGSVAHITAQHRESEPPWNELPALPPRLRRLLARLLAKDPAQRPDSPLEVRRELELCCASIERREALAARAAQVTRRPRQWLRRQPPGKIAAGLCALSLLALGALSALRPLPVNAPVIAALTPPPALLDAPEPVVVLRWSSAASGALEPPPTPINVAPIPDEWFLASEREWPDLGTPDAPFWTADFQRRRLLAREAEAAVDSPIAPPELLTDAGALLLSLVALKPEAPSLWSAPGRPIPSRSPIPASAAVRDPSPHAWRSSIAPPIPSLPNCGAMSLTARTRRQGVEKARAAMPSGHRASIPSPRCSKCIARSTRWSRGFSDKKGTWRSDHHWRAAACARRAAAVSTPPGCALERSAAPRVTPRSAMSSTQEITQHVKEASQWIAPLQQEISRVVIGQKYLVDGLLIGLLTNGHVLLEGVPGLAKTLTVKTLAQCIHTGFQRIQFTPDLLPADLIGTLIYNPRTGEFTTKHGPLFSNLILADEINRAPAKVQSALLEAMQERQVTIGDTTYPLADPFLVLATQNPLEQEGTYQLPEAQLDRFMLKLKIGYPSRAEERQILDLMATSAPNLKVLPITDPADVIRARGVVNSIYVDDRVKDYIVDVVFATREPPAYQLKLDGMIRYGASPRATIALTLAARARAFMAGRGYVTPQDVKSVGADVLRHRIIVSYEAEAENVTSEQIIEKIFANLPVP